MQQLEIKSFKLNKRAKAVERASKRVKENTGTGRDGSFGAGTVGQGMPSNPDFRGPGKVIKVSKNQNHQRLKILLQKQYKKRTQLNLEAKKLQGEQEEVQVVGLEVVQVNLDQEVKYRK